MTRYMKICVVVVAMLNVSFMRSVTIGPDDTTVDYFGTQQSLGNGDRIARFAVMGGGFFLTSSGVTATFDSLFPVSGDIGIRGGTLVLIRNLVMHNSASIRALGNVAGNFHTLSLSKMKCFPEVVTADITCQVSSVTNASSQSIRFLDWSADAKFLVVAIASQIRIYSWDGSSLTERVTVSAGSNINSVAWNPLFDWIAVARTRSGNAYDIYEFNRTTYALTLLSQADPGAGIDALAVSWCNDGDELAVGLEGGIRVHLVDGSGNLGSFASVSFPAGTIDARTLDWNASHTALAVGTSVNASFDELRVYLFSESPLSLTLAASLNIGQTVNSVSWNKASPHYGVLAVGLDGGTDNLKLYRVDGSISAINTTEGDIAASVNVVSWHVLGGCLAIGLDANSVGPGGELRIYSFAGNDLTIAQNIELGKNVFALAWEKSDIKYLAAGESGSQSQLRMYGAIIPTTVTPYTWSDLKVVLNSDVTLQTPIVFSGQSILDGNGYMLTLAETSSLAVASGGSLLMKNIDIAGVHDLHIQGIDSTSTFSFHDVTFVLDGDYTFDQGKFEVLGDFTISGDGLAFIYTSNQTSRVRGASMAGSEPCDKRGFHGRMILDHGVTFSYNTANPSRFMLDDISSQLIMKSSTLAALSALTLTKGTLIIDGKSYFVSTPGIMWGDGTAVNNLNLEIMPASVLEVTGKLVNKNV